MPQYTTGPIRNDQWPEALALWERVFGVGAWLFDSLHKGTERRKLEHTRVALDQDGKIVSAVDVFLREMNDANGKPQWVGAIGSVATLEEHRKHGLSGRLLEEVIRVMEAEGCGWSFLFTGVHGHYARYGWFNTPLRYRTGRVAESPSGRGRELGHGEIRTFLPKFMELGGTQNATLPLAHRRTPQYWEHAIYARMTRPERRVYADLMVRGYVVAQFEDGSASVLEAAGSADVIAELMGAVALEAKLRDIERVAAHLPDASWATSALWSLGSDWLWEEAPWGMSRAVLMPKEDVEAIFATANAHHSPLDDF